MPTGATIRVRGLRELNTAFANMDRHVAGDLKGELLRVAEPVRTLAQQLAVTRISGLARTNAVSGGEWGLMRIGATSNIVYVAPQKRGTRRPQLRRRNMGDLLMNRAMQPALEQNEGRTVAAVENMLDRLADQNGF